MNCVDWVHHDSVTTANPKYPVTMAERIERKKPTNADRIRSMTDEELAKKMSGLESFALTCGGGWPPEKWLDWLRQEAESCTK